MPTVLLIEDNSQDAKLAKQLLEALDCEVYLARNALEGLALVALETPDLVLLDLSLPDLDGRIVANRFRANPALVNTPIVALSERATESDERLARAYGCDAFFSKPLRPRLFPRQINPYLKQSVR